MEGIAALSFKDTWKNELVRIQFWIHVLWSCFDGLFGILWPIESVVQTLPTSFVVFSAFPWVLTYILFNYAHLSFPITENEPAYFHKFLSDLAF